MGRVVAVLSASGTAVQTVPQTVSLIRSALGMS
jgi:hypothetical protein